MLPRKQDGNQQPRNLLVGGGPPPIHVAVAAVDKHLQEQQEQQQQDVGSARWGVGTAAVGRMSTHALSCMLHKKAACQAAS